MIDFNTNIHATYLELEKNSCGEKETVAMQKVFKAMDRRMCRII